MDIKFKVDIGNVIVKEGDIIEASLKIKDAWSDLEDIKCTGKILYIDREKMKIDCSEQYESQIEVIEFHTIEKATLKILNK